MKSIFNKGFGCNSCRTGINERSDTSTADSGGVQTHAYITSPGYDGLPTYADMKSERILLQRHCGPYPGGQLLMDEQYVFDHEEE
jgi:hypothetical protein